MEGQASLGHTINELGHAIVKVAAMVAQLIAIIVEFIVLFALYVLWAVLRIILWLLPILVRAACVLFGLWSLLMLAQAVYSKYLELIPILNNYVVVVVGGMFVLVPVTLSLWARHFLDNAHVKQLIWGIFVFGGLIAWTVNVIINQVDLQTRLLLPILLMGLFSPLFTFWFEHSAGSIFQENL